VSPLASHPVQHIGYLVDDIAAAVDRWVETFGAGPFFWLGNPVALDSCEHRGAPCTLDYSAVIGSWGPIFVELTQVHRAEPESFRELFVPRPPTSDYVSHVCYVVDDPPGEAARLEEFGFERLFLARSGAIEAGHYAGPALDHSIELHHNSPAFHAFFAPIAAAAIGWDGSDPLRERPGSA
jgi:hypothetical protein